MRAPLAKPYVSASLHPPFPACLIIPTTACTHLPCTCLPCSGGLRGSIRAHPTIPGTLVYVAGNAVVISPEVSCEWCLPPAPPHTHHASVCCMHTRTPFNCYTASHWTPPTTHTHCTFVCCCYCHITRPQPPMFLMPLASVVCLDPPAFLFLFLFIILIPPLAAALYLVPPALYIYHHHHHHQ